MLKNTEHEDTYRSLANSINQGNCIAFLGAGVSASCEFKGEEHAGYPLAGDLLSNLKSKRKYLSDVYDLGAAAFLFRSNEGRAKLERFLTGEFDSDIEPLPAHNFLSELNFQCYISMNFDTLLEKKLGRGNHVSVVKDREVSHLTTDSVSVIKPHGSIEQPNTLRIASDETIAFEEDKPIMTNLMLSKLANRRVLFLGFSFSDSDFMQLLHYLKGRLGEYMPRGVAVMNKGSRFTEQYLDHYNVNVVKQDLTLFLDNLSKISLRQKRQTREDLQPWAEHEFFWELYKIRGLPSETQVIDALLAEIKRRLETRGNVEIDALAKKVNEAIELVLAHRTNFSALKTVGNKVNSIFDKSKNTEDARVWDLLQSLLSTRENISKRIAAQATEVVGESSKNILLYSQSQRVLDLLKGLDPTLQEDITLYVSECRPKSPSQFQDAVATVDNLQDTKYKIRILPDAVTFHYLDDCIDTILMGAHNVYRKNDENRWFVNTCGSKAILHYANDRQIDIKLVFEEDKITEYFSEDELDEVSHAEEETLGGEVIQNIRSNPKLSDRTRLLNVGYDLVPWYSNVEAVTDRE